MLKKQKYVCFPLPVSSQKACSWSNSYQFVASNTFCIQSSYGFEAQTFFAFNKRTLNFASDNIV